MSFSICLSFRVQNSRYISTKRILKKNTCRTPKNASKVTSVNGTPLEYFITSRGSRGHPSNTQQTPGLKGTQFKWLITPQGSRGHPLKYFIITPSPGVKGTPLKILNNSLPRGQGVKRLTSYFHTKSPPLKES